MEILVYRRGIPKIQEGFTEADLPELLKDETAVIWVDMDAPTELRYLGNHADRGVCNVALLQTAWLDRPIE